MSLPVYEDALKQALKVFESPEVEEAFFGAFSEPGDADAPFRARLQEVHETLYSVLLGKAPETPLFGWQEEDEEEGGNV